MFSKRIYDLSTIFFTRPRQRPQEGLRKSANISNGIPNLKRFQAFWVGNQGRRAIQILGGPLFPAHRIRPNISLTIPGIETKHRENFWIKVNRPNEHYMMHCILPTGVCPRGAGPYGHDGTGGSLHCHSPCRLWAGRWIVPPQVQVRIEQIGICLLRIQNDMNSKKLQIKANKHNQINIRLA